MLRRAHPGRDIPERIDCVVKIVLPARSEEPKRSLDRLKRVRSDFRSWGAFEICRPTPRMSVSRGKTGSERRSAKMTRLTPYGQKIETAQRRQRSNIFGLGPVLHNKLAVYA
jgi:hypothetical protein